MSWELALGVLVAPLALGAGAARLLGIAPRSDRLWFLGIAWCAGALATGLLVFAWSWTDVPLLAGWSVHASVAALGAALFALGARLAPAAAPFEAPEPGPRWERWLFAAAVALALLATVQRIADGSLQPIHEDDEAHFWALKAKALFLSGGFGAGFGELMSRPEVHHEDYPLLAPLLQVWTFATAGEVTHFESRLPIQAFAVSFVLVLSSALRRAVRPAAAAALLLVVLALPETAHQSRTAHADLMVALGAVLALEAWLRWRASGAAPWWRLMAVGLALLFWSKNEGLLYAAAALGAAALAALLRSRPTPVAPPTPRLAAWLLLPAALVALTWGVNARFGFENDVLVGDMRDQGFFGLLASQAGSHLPRVVGWMGERVALDPRHGSWLLLAILGLVLLLPREIARRRELLLPALAVSLAFVGYVLVFTGTPHPLDWHLETAARRVSWQVVPAAALWVAAVGGALLPAFGRR